MKSSSLINRFGIDRRLVLRGTIASATTLVGGGLFATEKSMLKHAAAYVKVDEKWTSDHHWDFLNALPPDQIVALKKVLDMDEKIEGRSKDASGIVRKVFRISNNLFSRQYRNSERQNYHEILEWIARHHEIPASVIQKSSSLALERRICMIMMGKMWDKMTPDQRYELMAKINPDKKLDHAALAASSGSVAILALAGAVSYYGFAFYMGMSVFISQAAGLLGITLPFAAYTGSSSLVAFLTGPVGIVLALITLGAAATYFGCAEADRTAVYIMQLHALKVAAMQEAGYKDHEAFPIRVIYPFHGHVMANRNEAREWETFVLERQKDGTYAIKAHSGYWCADSTLEGRLVANREVVGPWEKWKMIRNDDDMVSFLSHTGHYLAVEQDQKTVIANRTEIGKWGKFSLKQLDSNGSKVAIQCWHGTLLCAEGNHA
ncbi:MAG: hypothetical protein R3B84_14010 [Zavarzinella sp.]